jgi:protein phosphatase
MITEDTKAVSEEASTVDLPPLTPPWPETVRVEFGALSHPGRVRVNNEDHYLVSRMRKSLSVLHTNLPEEKQERLSEQEGYLLIVADGMGGHAGGEHASALVVRKVAYIVLNAVKWFYRLNDPDEDALMRELREGLEWIEHQVVTAARAQEGLRGMGTTLTAAGSFGADLFMLHVGDSRAYLFRDGQLRKLTRDHTLAQQMVDEGTLEPQDVRQTGMRHVLTNVVGGPVPGAVGEIHKLRLLNGDRLLMCTDGLTEMVCEDEITQLLAANPGSDGACRALVDAALNAGGRDNVSVVLAAYTIQA